ncbi:Rieske (2Fe-2S) protein [Streptomyces heilongjiangensis]|uniref:Cytochrome bc1 complex Rieske iron-sulfur subunit n=1 Tax=Streptomyces heilongjiangensis TaxID=945052 RepID=A0ABW1BD03_9ACTN|nr:Rieske (2Fe-2S) protein [Streptomyces heilongjiangensis]MDC2949811.1 Rieske (2Fe-2S) protein [Streptomyces heilongjiangensis]
MSSETITPASEPARRTMMAVAGVAGLAVALTACGSGDDSSGSSGSGSAASGSASGGGTGGDDAASGGTELAKTSDIPEGGGKIFEDENVVVTQPKAGEFKAFSSTCTHRGCAVKTVADGVINCPCHQSNFSIVDGSVKSGPATEALPAKEIKVSGTSITLA